MRSSSSPSSPSADHRHRPMSQEHRFGYDRRFRKTSPSGGRKRPRSSPRHMRAIGSPPRVLTCPAQSARRCPAQCVRRCRRRIPRSAKQGWHKRASKSEQLQPRGQADPTASTSLTLRLVKQMKPRDRCRCAPTERRHSLCLLARLRRRRDRRTESRACQEQEPHRTSRARARIATKRSSIEPAEGNRMPTAPHRREARRARTTERQNWTRLKASILERQTTTPSSQHLLNAEQPPRKRLPANRQTRALPRRAGPARARIDQRLQ